MNGVSRETSTVNEPTAVPDYQGVLEIAKRIAVLPLDDPGERDTPLPLLSESIDAATRDAARAMLRKEFASWAEFQAQASDDQTADD